MKDTEAEVLFNDEIAAGYFKMGLEAPTLEQLAKPGQFVQVRCGETTDPLLRRPLGIHRVVKGERLKVKGGKPKGIEILYKVVGIGTGLLSEKKKGDRVDILGPLGNGFVLPSASSLQPSAILIGGGIGVAPLLFLAETLVRLKVKTTVLLGARTKKLVLCEKDFRKIGCNVRVATDDGSQGCRGLVSKLFEKILRTMDHGPQTTIYACGPEPMLRCIAEISEKHSIQCQALLEEKMACGFGACLGCRVKVRQGGTEQGFINKLTCKDGPVFNTNEVIWE